MSNPEHAYGRFDAPFLVVLMAPQTAAEDRWLFEMMSGQCGIQKENVRVVYVVEDPVEGSTGRPSKTQLARNAARFRADMVASLPQVILPLGPDAFRAVTGLPVSIEDARGYVVPQSMWGTVTQRQEVEIGVYAGAGKCVKCKGSGIVQADIVETAQTGFIANTCVRCNGTGKRKANDTKYKMTDVPVSHPINPNYEGPVIPTLSPIQVEKTGFKVSVAFKADLQRAAAMVHAQRNGTSLPMIEDNFTFFTDLDSDEANADYGPAPLAVDTETEGIGSTIIVRFSVSDGKRTHTLPWTAKTVVWLRRQLQATTMVIMHNSDFDVPIMRAHGVTVPEATPVFDTMLAAVYVQPDLHKGLGRCSSVYLNLLPWKWRHLSEADPVYYSAKDAYVTALLFNCLSQFMKDLDSWDFFTKIQMVALPELSRMGQDGVLTDPVRVRRWSKLLVRRMERYNKLWAKWGLAGISPTSHKQMGDFFYKEWGLPVQRRKRDQMTSISTDALACINLREVVQTGIGGRKDAPWRKDPRCTPRLFDLLLSMRGCGTNLKTFAKVLTDEKGRIYPKYVPEAKDVENRGNKKRKGSAATGRLASRDPNFQNQPKIARFCYIPDSPDFCFVQADYVAAELHVIAAVSEDEALYGDLTSGTSIHTINAEQIGCERRTAKGIIFGTTYGAGPKKISDTIKEDDGVYVSVAEIKRVQQALAEKYWKTWAWRETIKHQVTAHSFMINDFNRIRFFYGGARDVPAAYDYIPQSTVADILWHVLQPVAVAARKLGGRMCMTVHDSIVVQVHKDNVPAMMAEMKRIMERKFDNVKPGFFIPVDFEVGAPGASWGELEAQELQEAA